MLELLKKTVFAGIGAAVTTKDRVESLLQDLVKQGKLSRDEAERMAEKIAADGRAEFERTKEEVSKNLSQLLGRDKLVGEDEFRKLELRVSLLEEKEAARDLGEISGKKHPDAQAKPGPTSAP